MSGLQSSARMLFLLFLGVLLVTPVWLVRYPPLLDYPNHLASGFVLAHLHDPGFRYSELYRAEWDAYPYVFPEAISVTLESLMPADLSGRIILSICLLAPPLGVWFFLRQANRKDEYLALWALAFSYNSFFLFGFVAYMLSFAACFVALGFWLRYLERPSPIRWIGLAVLFTVVYATHLIGFLVAGVASTTLLFVRHRPLRESVLTWLLFLPGCLFLLHVSRGGIGVPGEHELTFTDVGSKLEWLWGMFRANSSRATTGTLLMLVVSALVVRWRNPDFRWNAEWIAVGGALLAVYAFLPFSYGVATQIDRRVLPFFFITVLAMVRVGTRVRWLAMIAICVFLLRVWGTTRVFVGEQPQLAGLADAFVAIPAHARVFPVIEGISSGPYQHFWAYGTIERGWLSPYLFAFPGVYPLRVRPGAYAPRSGSFTYIKYDKLPDWTRVQMSYDYIWYVWASSDTRRFAPVLQAVGHLVYTGDGVDVYRVNPIR